MRTYIGPDIILSDLTEGPTHSLVSSSAALLNIQNYIRLNLDIS